jgi:hypothetical protein
MGQTISTNLSYNIPTTKNFKLSYCVQKTIKQQVEKKECVDLSNLVEEYQCGIVLQFIYYKLKHEGYCFKEYPIEQSIYRIDDLLETFSEKGIMLSNNAIINDIKIKKNCYEPTLDTIYHFLNNGKILLGGILLDSTFLKEVLNITLNKQPIISDTILIVGYNNDSLYLKTVWCDEIIKVENIYLSNIREIWDIEIKTFW